MKRRKALGHHIIRRIFIMLGAAALFLAVWTESCEPQAHIPPSYAMRDITGILEKDELEDDDYSLLYLQTGLGRSVIDKLCRQGRRREILDVQQLFFKQVKVECEPNTVISREEYLVDEDGRQTSGMRIVDVEDGDILITFCSHTFGWRNGHAALVTDGDRRLILEAQVLGSPSVVNSVDRWEKYPSFMILRLSETDEIMRKRIAEFAGESLAGIPYRLEAGILDNLAGKSVRDGPDVSPAGTHCSHLVWYAYQYFGYDLDSDRGLIVTPRDIAESRDLEIVQIYGMPEDYF